jgi:hypothetical protein
LPRFAPGQPDACNLSDVPVDPTILECISIDGSDPGKKNIVTTATGPKFIVHDYYSHSTLRSALTRAVITAVQAKTLNEAKEAEEARKAHHFRVLSVGGLWEPPEWRRQRHRH